jgi:superfamily II DNA or RNA helicase
MRRLCHTAAGEFVQTGLFSDLSTFDQLENRIAAFPERWKRGAAFEVFAEAYLVTQRQHDAAKVWPFTALPIELLQRLSLLGHDYGIDGVFETTLGQYNAYQVKFRSNRPALTWRELSTFIGLADSPHIYSRVLITNCDALPPVINERQGFFCIRGSDLDRLTVEDFEAIETWLREATYRPPRKDPQPHQQEALDALVPALRAQDRVSAIMACGTGKTLVSLWAAEKLKCSTALVLVPSLALLRQTVHEWLHETSWPKLAYLCVCSDPTVAQDVDALTASQSDLDFEVSTDSASVRRFLDAPFEGTKVVFSTYQSAAVVGRAMRAGEQFDIGIFDEAHKTAGREGRNYAFALEDSNIAIRKRLFMTATPRHYNPHERNQAGEAQLVFSMDNPQVYGQQAFILTFGKAARRKIICGYRVIISVITSDTVTNELLSRGEVLVAGDSIRARQVANQIALRDAINKYDVKKIFTFHKTVKSAASFVTKGSEGINSHVATFSAYHVNGEMPTAYRERLMRSFRQASRAIMSNARCLTEGVDVPAVDMVAFLSPRRSRVDIVQATGRAMRRSPGKSLGYVLVPLYVELTAGESVEEAVERAQFDEIWDVLQSIQEQDEVLADLIRHAARQNAKSKGFDDAGFADRIDFIGPTLTLEDLRRAVAARCIENLFPAWDVWLGKLTAFKERFGHCNVVGGWPEDRGLGSWVAAQRVKRKQGLLADEQIRDLDRLGFVWKFNTDWMEQYKALERYTREHGNPHVPRMYSDKKLAKWVWIQRHRKAGDYKPGGRVDLITAEQAALLDKLGFRWTFRDYRWDEFFNDLKAFEEKHGHCSVSSEKDGRRLTSWVKAQRRQYSNGGLDPERKAKLDSIGFSWGDVATPEERWKQMYAKLEEYRRTHGNLNVPWDSKTKLAQWMSAQRQRRVIGRLSQEQIRLLDGLGFRWQFQPKPHGSWENRLAEVAEFVAKHGHCNIPVLYRENPRLGTFVNDTRSQRKRGLLSAERIAKLDKLGFMWSGAKKVMDDGTSKPWRTRFADLLRYKEVHGNCDVPGHWNEDKKLANWVSQQRHNYNRGSLHPARVKLLEEAGFTWAVNIQKKWNARYSALLQFKSRTGNCDVPVRYKDDPGLGVWVATQRHLKKAGKLNASKQRLLEEIGFTWNKRVRHKRSIRNEHPET